MINRHRTPAATWRDEREEIKAMSDELKSGRDIMTEYEKQVNQNEYKKRREAAVARVLASGLRTADIHQPGTERVGTMEMGDAVMAAL